MNDIVIYNDAVEDPEVTLQIGSSRLGRYIKNIKNPKNEVFDLGINMKKTAKDEIKNANTIGFLKALQNYPGIIPEFFLEVPFANKDPNLFNELYYKKFLGQKSNLSRMFYRADVYFPAYGTIVELDSKAWHKEKDIPLDNTKENIIWNYYGVKTILRLNFASKNEWEIKRATTMLYSYLNTAKPLITPIIDFQGIVESWKLYNREILPFFPYIETITGDYYCEHSRLYSLRDVPLDTSSLPNNLKAAIGEENIRKPLIEVYKRIKNINLQII